MKITFIGATKDVTGSMTLITRDSGKILIDCGMFQGTPDIVKMNLIPLPFDPRDIDAIILTHAHLDHSGFIPRLVRLGFRGNIYCTKATMKLANIILADSAHILERTESHLLNGFYETEDAIVATSLFKTKQIDSSFDVLDLKITLQSAGHILGAASVCIDDQKERTVFSGDLGRVDDFLMYPPTPCPAANTVIMESTYGGKIRSGNLQDDLALFLKKVKKESKVGIIASFAVARSQMLIALIHQYYIDHPEEKVRFVIDGPMMALANKVYNEFAHEMRIPDELRETFDELEIIDHLDEWNSIKKQKGPLIIIASSGMVTGGRIWRYLENWQHDSNAVLFLPGYQAVGTSGKLLSEGKRIIHDETGKLIHWQGEVQSSSMFSSHADQTELISWLKNVDKDTKIYLNHGETESKIALRKKLLELGYQNCRIAETEH